MKYLRRTFLILMAVLVLAPVLTMELRHNVASEINNAMLRELDLSGGISVSNINGWLNDRVGFRTEALTANQLLDDKLFHELNHPNYAYGKDGYVFFKFNASSNYVNVDFLDAFCAYLRQMQDYCETRGVPFLYAVSPSKTTVYDQYLPEGYLYEDVFYPALYERLDYYGVNYTSNVELLKEKTKTEQVFNRKYDAGHWNDLGEFYAVNDLLAAVQEKVPEVQPWTMDDFEISSVTEEYLPLSRFPIYEEVPQFYNLLSGEMESIDGFSSLYRHPSHQGMYLYRRTDEAAKNLPRVLMFHGSYYNRDPLFYACAFQESYGIHNYENILYLPYYFNIFQPDYVIVSSAQYATTSTYFNYDNLCVAEINVPLTEVEGREQTVCALRDMSPVCETDGRLTKVTIQTGETEEFGYIITENGTELDLIKQETGVFTCTVDNQRLSFDNATVYLFS